MSCKQKTKTDSVQEKSKLTKKVRSSCSESSVCKKDSCSDAGQNIELSQSMRSKQPHCEKHNNYKEFIRFLLSDDIDDCELIDGFD